MQTPRHQTFHTRGFTLIEMIVALGVFALVITIAIGALLSLIATNQRLQAEQSVMTNLAFALDSMTREIRTGYNYVCVSANNVNQPINGLGINPPPKVFDSPSEHEDLVDATNDCLQGRQGSNLHGISFYEGGNSLTGTGARRVMYFYDETEQTIKRRVGNQSAQAIVSSAITVLNAEFFVTGTTPIGISNSSEDGQPTVTIYIEAKEAEDPNGKSFFVQTSVTQRTLDI